MTIMSEIDISKFGIEGLPKVLGGLVVEGGYINDQYVSPRVTIEYKDSGEWLKVTRNLQDKYGNNIEWQGPNSVELENNLCIKFPEHTVYFKAEFTGYSLHKITFVQYMNDGILDYKDNNDLHLGEIIE